MQYSARRVAAHSGPFGRKLSIKYFFLSENVSQTSIYPSEVIEVCFSVKNSFFIFIKIFFGYFTL